MKILSLNSSNIAAVGYDRDIQTMYVCFVDRKGDYSWYSYGGIGPDTILGMLFSESHGGYFAEEVRAHVKGVKLTSEEVNQLEFHV